MITDIVDFLPKYSDINDPNFNLDIYNKKEFYDEKLEKYEAFPKNRGDLLKAQIIISRFLSSYTPYNELLLTWNLGTGKTCAAVATIEKIKNENNIYTGALILARGDNLIQNFKEEIIFKCTSGYYIPEDYETMTSRRKTQNKNKMLNTYYEFSTFETFAKYISNTDPQTLIDTYSNKIIVIDEVHNIRLQDMLNRKKQFDAEGNEISYISIYDNFYKFLHLLKNRKIILISGTPLKDTIDEISSVMNLILPMDKQLPKGKAFISEFFDLNGELYVIKPEKKQELKNAFKGRVSCLETQSNVRKVIEGQLMGKLKHFLVYPDIMSEFQTEGYTNAVILDSKRKTNLVDDEKRSGFYSHSRQASLFVFPDKSYGKEGFDKYVKLTSPNVLTGKQKQRYVLSKEMKDEFKGKNILEKIHKFSSKYNAVIKNILEAQKTGKSSFVYCEYVEGSGGILFSLILELFGFSRYIGKDSVINDKGQVTVKEGKRYAIMNNQMSTLLEFRNIRDLFNHPDNKHGKFLNVIIGSKVISEGLSFKNVQEEHILTPHWNYSETYQAIGRGYRFNSHADLINSGINPMLKVYQYVSVPDNPDIVCVDLRLYEMSEIKDINIKGVERIMKESAFDCALNYDRNYIQNYDFERECQYMACDYRCDNNIGGYPVKLDMSTYQIYYNHKAVENIIETIKTLFKHRFEIHLDELVNIFKLKYSFFDLVTSLYKIIKENINIVNKYGVDSFLREDKNIFFLVNTLHNIDNVFSNYYNEFPVLSLENSYLQILENIYFENLPRIIDTIFNSTDRAEIVKILKSLKVDITEMILEASIQAQNNILEKNVLQRETILEYLSYAIEHIDDVLISSLLYREKNILRCFSNDNWENCDDEYINLYKKSKQQAKTTLKKENQFVGLYNEDNFCILKTNFKDDKRNENSGQVCMTWSKQILLHIINIILKIPLDISHNTKKWATLKKDLEKIKNDREKLVKNVIDRIEYCEYDSVKNKWDTRKYEECELEQYSDDELVKMLYYSNITRSLLCDILKKWFEDNNILEYDANCGTSKKKKVVI